MEPEFKVFARLAGIALSLVAFVTSCYLENVLDVRRPRGIQPQSGMIYLHPDKHPEFYISAIDVNENRLLWMTFIAGMLITVWFSSPSRKAPVEKSRSPIVIITSKLWFEELFFLATAILFTAVIILLGPSFCEMLADNGIVIFPLAG